MMTAGCGYVPCREQRAMLASELEKNSNTVNPPEQQRIAHSPLVVGIIFDLASFAFSLQ